MSIRVAFAGHGAIAPPCLKALAEDEDVQTCGVFVHSSDLDAARHANEEIAGLSRDIGCPTVEIDRAGEMVGPVKDAGVDILVSVGFLRIFPPAVLALPRFGGINIHGALLPKYRGRAPISWALIHGEKVIGVTVHYMDPGVDSGNIILQRRIRVSIQDTAKTLFDKVKKVSPDLLLEATGLFVDGPPAGVPQDESIATCNGSLTPEVRLVRWNEPAGRVHDRIRALVRPYPGAYTFYGGKKYLIWRSSLTEAGGMEQVPGKILEETRRGVIVAAGGGAVLIEEVEGGLEGTHVPDWEVGKVLSESEDCEHERNC